MYGWQEPLYGSRIYLITDNTYMVDFELNIREADKNTIYISSGESRINLGIHKFQNKLYSANFVGICRIKNYVGENLVDDEGNILLLKVVPRFQIGITELLNYIREDDEFDRYLAPQTKSNRHNDKEIEEVDKNEIFYFYENEKPLKVDDNISEENGIITVTVFLSLLKGLCKRPLMGKMLSQEENLTGKIKGKVVVEKNIRYNSMRGRNDRFYCRYLRYTDNIVENQILKFALKKAKRFLNDYFGTLINDRNYYTGMISYCANVFRNIDDINYTGADCRRQKFSGCYAYYRPVMSMAEMILDDISIESNGSVSLSGFIIPYAISMEKLFEVYVRAYLKRNGVKSYKEDMEEGLVIEKYDEKIDTLIKDEQLKIPAKYIEGPIKPDIIISDLKSDRKIVFDVKYKDYKNSSSRNDRLQLLAYSMMLNADHIGLIFPSSDGSIIFDERDVNSLETRSVKYHQFALSMDRNDSRVAEHILNNF